MAKNYLFLAALFLCLSSVQSQINYNFSAINGTYTDISGGSTAVLQPDGSGYPEFPDYNDDAYSSPIPIGFSFNYNGTNYTTISANTNGFASFRNFVQVDGNNYDYYTPSLDDGPYSSTTTRPILAPLWDDNEILSNVGIKYITTGTFPTRVFTLEWNDVWWDASSPYAPAISFQVKLYETTNVVEFRYKQLAGQVSRLAAASIGITGTGIGSGNYISLSSSSASPAANTDIDTDNINTKPATGQIYRFTPQTTFPITLSGFSGVRKNNIHLLSWITDQEAGNKGFEVQRAGTDANFEVLAFVNTKAPRGTSSLPVNYYFEDASPLNGKNFYRLKQIDLDGRTSVSPVVTIEANKGDGLVFTRLYPLPSGNNLTVGINSASLQKVHLLIKDLQGKALKHNISSLKRGYNSVVLPVRDLPKGMYVLQAISETSHETITTQFIR